MVGGILFTLLVTCAVIYISSWAWKAFVWVWLNPRKLEKCLREQGIKGPSYKFLSGNLKDIVSATQEARAKPMELSHKIVPRVMPFVHQTVEKYGKLSFIWYGPYCRVNIMDPDMIRDILSNKFGHFEKIRTNPLGKLLISGVVSYEGEKWVKHRRILNPAFHLEKLKMMLPAIYTSCSEMVNKWEMMVSQDSCELDVWPHLQNLTADVISRTAFGSSYEEGRRIFQLQSEQAGLVIKALQSIYIPGLRFLPTKRNNRMKEIYGEARVLLRDIVNKREKAMKIGEAHNDDLLGLLMESNFKEITDNVNSKNFGMTIDEVIDECKLFYFAGQETTSTLLVWTMVVLSMHPDWQEKAREEVLQVFGGKDPDFDGLNHLKIVTMILYEVLRLYPPAVLMARGTYKTMKLGEITLPAGVHLAMPTLLVHHDRELWGEDAEDFNPERFSGGVSKATKNQVSFFPFSWGPRICIGQNFALLESKMAIAMILQRFSFELSSTYVHAPYTVITLQPQHGAQLILHKL
uniref:Cytochrome P450 n=1 Tax=Coptis japonica var. dissecta TaxID=397412 RepID=A9ZT56_COPJA|nr:cytochrome P450 [Coptis japonica var. dissecta]